MQLQMRKELKDGGSRSIAGTAKHFVSISIIKKPSKEIPFNLPLEAPLLKEIPLNPTFLIFHQKNQIALNFTNDALLRMIGPKKRFTKAIPFIF